MFLSTAVHNFLQGLLIHISYRHIYICKKNFDVLELAAF